MTSEIHIQKQMWIQLSPLLMRRGEKCLLVWKIEYVNNLFFLFFGFCIFHSLNSSLLPSPLQKESIQISGIFLRYQSFVIFTTNKSQPTKKGKRLLKKHGPHVPKLYERGPNYMQFPLPIIWFGWADLLSILTSRYHYQKKYCLVTDKFRC